MDLFSQAEHDELAQAMLLTPDAGLRERSQRRSAPAARACRGATSSRPRWRIAGRSMLTRDLDEAVALCNRIAPEHLEIVDRRRRGAGCRGSAMPAPSSSGHYSSEALGDYCAGPNHVLPTARTARFSSPLGVYDFVKRSNVIHVSAAGAQRLGPVAATLARGEHLVAHAMSAELRLTGNGTTR